MSFYFCSSRGSYHGGSPQTMGLTSNAAYKYPIANGLGCTNVCKSSYIPLKYIIATDSVSLPTEQTMCPDVFRGPWGGSHCRDSPVQTIRDCSCAQGTTTHASHMHGSPAVLFTLSKPLFHPENTSLCQFVAEAPMIF